MLLLDMGKSKTFFLMEKNCFILEFQDMNIIYSGICKLETGPGDNYPGYLEYEYYLLRDL